jgi:PPOX class probable F420-dependent enzyme
MDWNSEEGKKLAERLRSELVIWLTTVGRGGMPVPTPVWFLWEDDSFLIYTIPGSVKLKNIAVNSKAALNLNSDKYGGEVAVFTGQISVDQDQPPALQYPEYLEKYRKGIQDIQMTPETFSKGYSVALRFKPAHIRIG